MIKSLLPLIIFMGCILSACYPDKQASEADYLRYRVEEFSKGTVYHHCNCWDDMFLEYGIMPFGKLNKYDEVYRYKYMSYDTNVFVTYYRIGTNCSYDCKYFSTSPSNAMVYAGYWAMDFTDVKGVIPYSEWDSIHNAMVAISLKADRPHRGNGCITRLSTFNARIYDSLYCFSSVDLYSTDEWQMHNAMMKYAKAPDFDSAFSRSRAINEKEVEDSKQRDRLVIE